MLLIPGVICMDILKQRQSIDRNSCYFKTFFKWMANEIQFFKSWSSQLKFRNSVSFFDRNRRNKIKIMRSWKKKPCKYGVKKIIPDIRKYILIEILIKMVECMSQISIINITGIISQSRASFSNYKLVSPTF